MLTLELPATADGNVFGCLPERHELVTRGPDLNDLAVCHSN
jgi:hypothetical protein